MFGVLFGWRKASKCKKVIKEAQCRLKLLKKKRHSIVKHLREDTANLIKFGHEAIALTRAEQLIKDESVAVAYELIDNFCDFIRMHFSYIRRCKDFPDDVNEAVSSLIYASARCGDLPELRVIRNLFEERYGHKLAMTAVELFPGNLVNQQIKEALNTKFVSDDMKLRMVNEIATDYCLQRQILALEYDSKWQQELQVKESIDYRQVVATDIQTSMHEKSEARSLDTETQRQVILADTIVEESSSDSLPRFSEETMLVYLDDIVEFPSSKDEDSQDQRVFKFKSSILSKSVSSQTSIDQTVDDENSSTNGSQRSQSVSRKRSRRRLMYPEKNSGIKDMECSSYYAQPHKSRYSQQRKQMKKSQPEEQIWVAPLARNQQCDSNEGTGCGSPPLKQQNLSSRQCRERVASSAESNNEKGWSRRTRKNHVSCYLRNETMPVERSKGVAKDEFQRSNSCPVQEHPNHVHPKLPDYDDLTARFMAMKKEFVMNSNG